MSNWSEAQQSSIFKYFLKYLKGKKTLLFQNVYPENCLFKNKSEIKTFLDTKVLREFIPSQPSLQGMLRKSSLSRRKITSERNINSRQKMRSTRNAKYLEKYKNVLRCKTGNTLKCLNTGPMNLMGYHSNHKGPHQLTLS